MEFGVEFIPEGAGARAAVQGAKTFAENGLEASSFFGDWVGPACRRPDWNFDLFGALLNQPDSVGVSTGCHRKKGCQKIDPKPDPTNKPIKTINKPTGTPALQTTAQTTMQTTMQTTDKTTDNTDSQLTSQTNPTTTSDATSACAITKRAPPLETREGKFGEDEKSEECNNNVKTMHITKTDMNNIGSYEETIGAKCGRELTQACYHYK